MQCKTLHTFIYATVYSISAHRAHHQLLSLRGSQATPHIDADSYGLLRTEFVLDAVENAEPPADMMNTPSMKDDLHRPMMLLVKATAVKEV